MLMEIVAVGQLLFPSVSAQVSKLRELVASGDLLCPSVNPNDAVDEVYLFERDGCFSRLALSHRQPE